MSDTAEPPRILLVEDNRGDAHLVRLALDECLIGAGLIIAENAVQAFNYLAAKPPYTDRRPPTLIVLDLNLPAISGREVLRVIRATPEWRHLPVVVYSSSNALGDREYCARLGALAYIVKPNVWGDFVQLGKLLKQYLDDASTIIAKRACADGGATPKA